MKRQVLFLAFCLLALATPASPDSLFHGWASFPTAGAPWGVKILDVNGDSLPDLVSVNRSDDNISVLLGTGDGTFGTHSDFEVGVGSAEYDGPEAFTTGDFNRDGRTDIAAACTYTQVVSVILGNGDGTFQAAQNYAIGGTYIDSVANGDLNGDGFLDLATIRAPDEPPYSEQVSILLGNGNGTFTAPRLYVIGGGAWWLDIGDVNRDGRQDIVVAKYNDNYLSVMFGLPGNVFRIQDFAVGTNPQFVEIGDLNGDSWPDLMTANYGWLTPGAQDVSVLLNTKGGCGVGDPCFRPAQHYATGDDPCWIGMGDLTGDGRPELAVTNYMTSDTAILTNRGDGTFQNAVNYATGMDPRSVALGDVNEDGLRDVVVANYGNDNVTVLTGNGDGSLQGARSYLSGDYSLSVVIGDLNEDGRPDLAVANRYGNDVSILVGNGAGSFGAPTSVAAGEEPYDVLLADFNGDGHLDLATANYGGNDATVRLGNGNGTFGTSNSYQAGDMPTSIAAGDLDGEGSLDLVVANRFTDDVTVLLGSGDGSFTLGGNYAAGSGPYSVGTDDLNGDGRLDLAVANLGSGKVSVLIGNGDGSFQGPIGYAVGAWPSSVAIGDLNGDQDPDLAVTSMLLSGQHVSVLLNRGNGTFLLAGQYDAGTTPSSVAIEDLNGDGRPDLAVSAVSYGELTVWIGKGDGSFQNRTTVGAGAWPEAVAAGDLNGDGHPDLVLANTTGTVSVMLNTGIEECTDNDGDGYGNPASPACAHPETDCNDNEANINPGVAENCTNAIDDNCNGLTDRADAACRVPGCSAAAFTRASRYGSREPTGSDMADCLAMLLLPLGTVLTLRRIHRRNK